VFADKAVKVEAHGVGPFSVPVAKNQTTVFDSQMIIGLSFFPIIISKASPICPLPIPLLLLIINPDPISIRLFLLPQILTNFEPLFMTLY